SRGPARGEIVRRVGIATVGIHLHVCPEPIRPAGRAAEKERAEGFGPQLDLKADALPVLFEDELRVLAARIDVRLKKDRELHAALRSHAIRAFDPARAIELRVR